MLRHTLISVSALAILSTTACAQEEATATAELDAQILDAAQVETKDEAKLFAEAEFKQADINQDGKVDKNEFLAYAVIRAPLPNPDMEGLDEPSIAESDEVASMEQPESAEEQFAEISNGDEVISESEMVESRIAQFDEADTNDDEALDETERDTFIKLSQLKPASSTSL